MRGEVMMKATVSSSGSPTVITFTAEFFTPKKREVKDKSEVNERDKKSRQKV
jgi:hypothetical protein